MLAVGILTLLACETLTDSADVVGALTLDALRGTDAAFDERIHAARPHPGQLKTAENLRKLLKGSEIRESHRDCKRVQDAYSLRCMPQVHGAVRDALAHAREVFHIEMNAAVDNPLVFADKKSGGGTIISGGNFHGEPLALAAAYLAPALAEVAAMSERRTARLVDPRLSEGLPAFLAADPGMNSGLMIPQYVAAALVLENQALAHPAAVGSLPTSANQEDHVSNGAVAALHATRILRNAEIVVAIEALTAAQGLDWRKPLQPGAGVAAAHARLREEIATLAEDRALAPDIERATRLVREGALVEAAEKAVGRLT
jgi:histidine ammonia-lyase